MEMESMTRGETQKFNQQPGLEMPETIRRISNIADRELAWRFFVLFSRMEYALKRSGYLRRDAKRAEAESKAEPDWDSFASKNKNNFFPDSSAELKRAISYFREFPPRKQIVNSDGTLGWSGPRAQCSEPLLKWLLLAVRDVRNNLFHGGKFPTPDGPVTDPARDTDLLEQSICILLAVLPLDERVRHAYDETC